MGGMLEGLRVVEIGGEMAAPIAGMLLADNGADVVKVEPPGGDPFRALPGARVWNRGKKSAVIDFDAAGGRAALDGLLARADIVITGLEPAELRRLGLDGATLHGKLSRLVVVNVTGYGLEGRDSERPGYDALVSARLGLQHQQAGQRPGPHYLGFATASYSAAMLAVLGATTALYLRDGTGEGRWVDVSLKDGALAFMTMEWARSGGVPTLAGEFFKKRLLVQSYRCGDDKWLHFHTGAAGAFERLMEGFGLDQYVRRPFQNADEWNVMVSQVTALLLTKPRAHWLEVLDRADVPNLPVLGHGEVLHDEQSRVMGFAAKVQDPELGELLEVGLPLIFERAPGGIRGSWPKVGEHTEEVLAEAAKAPPAAAAPAPVPPGATHAPGTPALQGLKVVDFGHFFAGPYASRLLADCGADVVKVEVLTGDPLRRTARAFNGAQRGKRAIAIDLKSEEGQRIGRELLQWADVVQHNLRPGVAERLGMDYATAKELNPDIVYLYSPGFGARGPRMNSGSFEPLVSALVGIQDISAGDGNPPVTGQGNMDYGNAMLGACGIVMAINRRNRTGESQYVECAQMSSGMLCTAEAYWLPDGTLAPQWRLDSGQYGIAPLLRLYETSDGWICIACHTDGEWQRLIKALDLTALAADPLFATVALRVQNGEALISALSARFREKKAEEWFAIFEGLGVPSEIPLPDGGQRFLDDPENVRRQWVAEYEHPVWGTMREIGALVRFSDATSRIERPAPTIGQHTDEILAMLGMSSDEVAALHDAKVVRATLETGAVT